MDEHEWLTSNNPFALLSAPLTSQASARGLRLFACACYRVVWNHIEPDEHRELVEVAEAVAEGEATAEELAARYDGLVRGDIYVQHDGRISTIEWVEDAVYWTRDVLWWAKRQADPSSSGHGEDRPFVALLHDIFGNPFHPVAFDPAWRTPTVVSLAQAAYDERLLPSGELDRDRLLVLADALEEAGADTVLLEHLRSPGPHVRGCFAVDALLGKE
jgi:hypothetical protein